MRDRVKKRLTFLCKARYFCPSCHAKRLALWTLWLEETLLEAAVPHRQVVLTIRKRLRAWWAWSPESPPVGTAS